MKPQEFNNFKTKDSIILASAIAAVSAQSKVFDQENSILAEAPSQGAYPSSLDLL